MGRQVKRVPLDFDQQIGEVWQGFLNPYYEYTKPCKHCDETGSSPLARILSALWYASLYRGLDNIIKDIFLLPVDDQVSEEAKMNVLRFAQSQKTEHELRPAYHPKSNYPATGWHYHLEQEDVDALLSHNRLWDFKDVENVTAEMVNKWALHGFGHDSINNWVCVGHRCEKWGIKTSCKYCDGHGMTWDTEEHKQLCEDWEPVEPPVGEGWQLWENTTEGSPMSPVFATPEELIAFVVETEEASYEAARQFVMKDHESFTMIAVDNVLMNGIEGNYVMEHESEELPTNSAGNPVYDDVTYITEDEEDHPYHSDDSNWMD